MNVSIILGHPASGSFNHAIAAVAAQALRARGDQVILHDLHAERFDPVYTPAELVRDAVLPPDIEEHCRQVLSADALIVVHPNYWGRPPAMVCGWVDRVLRSGRAYRFVPDGKGGARPQGLLKVRHAIVFNTANTPDDKEKALYGDPLDIHWRKVVFGLCAVPNVYRRCFTSVIVSTPEQRAAWLEEVRRTVVDKLV